MNVALLLPNWIGDVVMATPAIRAMREHYGSRAKIVGVMKPYVSKVLDSTDWLDDAIFFQRGSKDVGLRTWSVIRQLRRLQPHTVVTFTHSLRGAYMAWMSGAQDRVGFARNGSGVFLTKRLRAPREDGKYVARSAIDHYLELATAIGCRNPSTRMELATSAADEAETDLVWQQLGLKNTRVVTFNTGSGSGDARVWPKEHCIALARRLADMANVSVLLLCGPGAEQQTAREIVAAANHPGVVSMADQNLALGVAKACVRRSDLLISTDSGPRHFGPAFDVPVVALFGSIHWKWSDSHHQKSVYLDHPIECAPCNQHTCPLGHRRCMTELSVDRVLQASLQQLQKWSRRAA